MNYRKCVGILCLVCMLSNTQGLVVSAEEQTENLNNEIQENEVVDIQEDEDYYDLRETDVSDIITNCEDVEIVTVEELQSDNEIEEIGENSFENSELEKIEPVNVSEEIVIGNIGIPIYPAYNDSLAALDKVKEDCGNILNTLQNKYEIPELTDETWDEYYKKMYVYLDENDKVDWYDEFNDEFVELSNFYDIYENNRLNNYLVTTAARANNISDLTENEIFLSNLPYSDIDELVETGLAQRDENGGLKKTKFEYKGADIFNEGICTLENNGLDKRSTSLLAYHKSNAITYAKNYAKDRNTNFGYIDGADCTDRKSTRLNSSHL